MATKKTTGSPKGEKASPAAKTEAAKAIRKRASSPAKDPKGGLTAEGRKAFAEKEGSHLRPGVQGPADTPEKMLRKGSFLRRHFANPRGPMERDGDPTRLALSAHAWGEPVPKTEEAAKKLAAKGKDLLDRYHQAKGDKPNTVKKTSAKAPAKRSPGRKPTKSAQKSAT